MKEGSKKRVREKLATVVVMNRRDRHPLFPSSSIVTLRLEIVPKKVELLIRFFEPFWISRVFHFSLRTFEEVGDLPDPFGASDETNTQSKIDISGSNETMQNALASIV